MRKTAPTVFSDSCFDKDIPLSEIYKMLHRVKKSTSLRLGLEHAILARRADIVEAILSRSPNIANAYGVIRSAIRYEKIAAVIIKYYDVKKMDRHYVSIMCGYFCYGAAKVFVENGMPLDGDYEDLCNHINLNGDVDAKNYLLSVLNNQKRLQKLERILKEPANG